MALKDSGMLRVKLESLSWYLLGEGIDVEDHTAVLRCKTCKVLLKYWGLPSGERFSNDMILGSCNCEDEEKAG